MSKYAIFSDLHLGDGGKHDLFGKKDYFLLKIFAKLISKNYTILLNGDVFEYWKNTERSVYKAHQVLIDFIKNSPRVILIIGNHDFDLMGHFTYTFEMRSGKKVLVSHGFQNDKWMVNSFLRFLLYLATWLERFVGLRLETVFSGYTQQIDKGIEKRTLDYARKMFSHFDLVICGHTHVQTRLEEGEKIYLNSGHVLGDSIQYLKVNTTKELIKFYSKKIKLKKS
jgi:UDP-2,3-diacylglucosamine pyrophosphatase LpxH